MKKIVLIVSGIAKGGVETFIKNYFKYIDKNEMDLYIITHNLPNENEKKEFEELGFKVLIVPPKSKNFLKNIWLLNYYMKKYKFDVVHSNMSKMNFLPMLIAKINNIEKRISHAHNAYNKNNFILQFLNRRYANQFLACSKEALISCFGKKILNGKYRYEIIYNAIEIKRYKFNEKNRAKIRKQYNIDNDTILLGNIGRITKQKNQKFLIDILYELLLQKENIKLMIVGTGNLKNKLINYTKKLNCFEKVIFVESNNLINEYYSAFDIFLLPSKFEGLGIVAIEAQASGIQCAVSENLPNEVIISKKIKFLSIKNINEWIEFINNYKEIKNNRTFELIESKYNIESEYIKLQKIYYELNEKDKNKNE